MARTQDQGDAVSVPNTGDAQPPGTDTRETTATDAAPGGDAVTGGGAAPQPRAGSAGSSPSAGSTGTGIAADETGFGESGSLPDTAAPPVAQ
jgi:hypothetical protein